MPFNFSDVGVELGALDDTVNHMSIDQVILEEAPLPELMEKKRSARSNKEKMIAGISSTQKKKFSPNNQARIY